jgi:uncharacterized membrane protein (UPF0127 family)
MAPARAQMIIFNKTLVTVVSGSGRFPFTVDIADLGYKIQRGLAFRRSLPADQGMLILYPRPRVITVDTTNVAFVTDVLFLRDDGRVVELYRAILPNATLTSQNQVTAALQLLTGSIARTGVHPGDYVACSLFHHAI